VGRHTEGDGGLSGELLWPEDEPPVVVGMKRKAFRPLRYPLWTQNKARLIQAYLRLFEFITHHGTYIDGFAAPQDPECPETWAAKLVLDMEPKMVPGFLAVRCDISRGGCAQGAAGQARLGYASRKKLEHRSPDAVMRGLKSVIPFFGETNV
jgi:hypothetical protein